MTLSTKTTIKAFFETGDKPTQSQFSDFIDSCAFLAEVSAQVFTGSIFSPLVSATKIEAVIVSAGTANISNLNITNLNVTNVSAVTGNINTINSTIINTTNVSASTINSVNATFSGIVSASTLRLTNPLSVTQGGTGLNLSDPVVQRISTVTGAVNTGTTTIPRDDTIPQITEGTEFMTLAITPKNSANILVIDVVICLSTSAAGLLTAALFQDSTANALAAVATNQTATLAATNLAFRFVMTAGTTSSTTFRIRGGCNSAGTVTFNGENSARIYGGVLASSITITEYST